MTVPATTLDEAWRGAGCPEVSFVKIDTEGGEEAVVRGAPELLTACRPVLLVEDRGGRAAAVLTTYGYSASRPEGFAAGNYLFTPDH